MEPTDLDKLDGYISRNLKALCSAYLVYEEKGVRPSLISYIEDRFSMFQPNPARFIRSRVDLAAVRAIAAGQAMQYVATNVSHLNGEFR